MEFIAKTLQPEKQRTGCLIVGVFQNRRLTEPARLVDQAAGGAITKLLRGGDMEGKLETALVVQALPGVSADRVLLVGCGVQDEFSQSAYRKALQRGLQALTETGAGDAAVCLTEMAVPDRDAYWKVRQAVEGLHALRYRFDRLKSKKEPESRKLRRVLLGVTSKEEVAAAEDAIRHGNAIAAGVNLARDLGNLPANICTPSYLAEQARQLGRRSPRTKVSVLSETQMEKLGMGSLLAVARGSREPAKLITIEYRGGKKAEKPVVLVGKGVTFDSGGISIKPAAAMDEMKYDMCGAASVLGALAAAIELDLPLNVVGVIPATENLPDGNASKPGDIVTTLSGQSVEILNTDAEGRLILNDALTYAGRFHPEVVIDMATLTGACVIALGAHASGLFSNDPGLRDALLGAGTFSGDRAWELPLWEEYQEQLKSNFADMANVGGREAGAITAACFLARYTKDYRWAHLDIAGTAWKTGKEKGATGRPVPLLTQFLLDRTAKGAAPVRAKRVA